MYTNFCFQFFRLSSGLKKTSCNFWKHYKICYISYFNYNFQKKYDLRSIDKAIAGVGIKGAEEKKWEKNRIDTKINNDIFKMLNFSNKVTLLSHKNLFGYCLFSTLATTENDTSNKIIDVKLKNGKVAKTKLNVNSLQTLSIEEALYCAKVAGIYTTSELQKQIITSPSFSPNRNPFLIENFFSSMEEQEEDEEEDILEEEMNEVEKEEELEEETEKIEGSNKESNNYDEDEKMTTKMARDIIDKTIIENFNPSCKDTFYHNGLEWLVEAEGMGTRKRAVAHVVIRRGTGIVKVNNEEDLYIRWPYIYNRMDVIQPFYLTKTAGVYDLFISTRGGGSSGQSAATRLAVGRALVKACPHCESILQEDLVLYEDTRQKMPKMAGRRSARKQKAWSKR